MFLDLRERAPLRSLRRGVAQPGSAPALGAGGRWFESSRPDHMDQELVVAELERGPDQKIVIRRTFFRGREYLDIRNFFLNESGEWLPTKRGIAIPWELRGELARALARAEELASEQG